jgi:hypothetical protein
MAAAMGFLWIENVHGMGWREKRFLKLERKTRRGMRLRLRLTLNKRPKAQSARMMFER